MIERLNSILVCEQPVFFLLAGPNGAGKSTFRQLKLTPLGLNCIDPDQIALEKYGRHPSTDDESRAATIEATRLARVSMLSGATIGLETVFSDTSSRKLNLLKEAKSLGYKAGIIFIGINDHNLAIARVMDRVEQKGHDVTDDKIINRFPKVFENLQRSLVMADFIILIDNSSEYGHQVFGAYTPENGIEVWGELPRWYHSINW